MIVPWALVFRICEKSMLQLTQILLDLRVRNRILLLTLVKYLHQLCSIVPCTVVAEVLFYQFIRHLAFLIQKLILDDLWVSFSSYSLGDLIQILESDRLSVIPAVKVSLIHAKHFITQFQLSFQNARLPLTRIRS